MTLLYSTSAVAPHERASYWREVANREFARHEFHSKVGPSFRGEVHVDTLGSLALTQFDCDPCVVRRKEGPLSSCQSDDFIFTLLLSGKSVFDQDGREVELTAGSMTLIDLQRSASIDHGSDIRSLSVVIPRAALEARIANAKTMTTRRLTAQKPVGGLLSGFLTMLSERAQTLGDAGPKVAEQLLDLIGLVLSTEAGVDVSLSSPKTVALLRLKSAIEGRLAEPELKPAAAASSAGMSVRYANMLLSQEGYSVERYIQYRRLERCRRALEDPWQVGRTIGEIAFSWGFSDLSHFGRRFRAEYGLSPGDYRRRSLDEQSRRSAAE